MICIKPRIFWPILLLLVSLISSAEAQTHKENNEYDYWQEDDYSFTGGTRIMLGYSANLPNQNLGFTMGFTRPQAWGIYADYKMDAEILDIAKYLDDKLTIEYVENNYYYDTLKIISSHWISINAGITWPLNSYFCAYGGAGVSLHKFYRQYHEPYGYKGDNGYYWIPDDATSSVNLNISAGAYYRMGRYFYFQLGGDIHPLGISLGVGLAL